MAGAGGEVGLALMPPPLPPPPALWQELFPKNKAAQRHGHHVLIEYTMLRWVGAGR